MGHHVSVEIIEALILIILIIQNPEKTLIVVTSTLTLYNLNISTFQNFGHSRWTDATSWTLQSLSKAGLLTMERNSVCKT
jgi:hypothetical protein